MGPAGGRVENSSGAVAAVAWQSGGGGAAGPAISRGLSSPIPAFAPVTTASLGCSVASVKGRDGQLGDGI